MFSQEIPFDGIEKKFEEAFYVDSNKVKENQMTEVELLSNVEKRQNAYAVAEMIKEWIENEKDFPACKFVFTPEKFDFLIRFDSNGGKLIEALSEKFTLYNMGGVIKPKIREEEVKLNPNFFEQFDEEGKQLYGLLSTTKTPSSTDAEELTTKELTKNLYNKLFKERISFEISDVIELKKQTEINIPLRILDALCQLGFKFNKISTNFCINDKITYKEEHSKQIEILEELKDSLMQFSKEHALKEEHMINFEQENNNVVIKGGDKESVLFLENFFKKACPPEQLEEMKIIKNEKYFTIEKIFWHRQNSLNNTKLVTKTI